MDDASRCQIICDSGDSSRLKIVGISVFCSVIGGDDLSDTVNVLRQKWRGVPQEFGLSIVRLIGPVLASGSLFVRARTTDQTFSVLRDACAGTGHPPSLQTRSRRSGIGSIPDQWNAGDVEKCRLCQ